MIALVIFVVLDYVTGIMCAIADKKLSSSVGFKASAARCSFSCWWAWPTLWTCNVVGSGSVLRGAVVCFYLSNEGVSMLGKRRRISACRAGETQGYSGAAARPGSAR